MTWRCGRFELPLAKTRVMAVVNVTPDSFSDGGRYFRTDEAIARARHALEEGADILDLGGESTRPDATPLGWQEEWQRLEGVIEALRDAPVPLSVDTYHAETAERALAAGASIVNCVRCEAVRALLPLVRRSGAGFVVPGRPAGTCPRAPMPPDADALALGDRTLVDPLIGFDTTREEDFALLGALRRLAGVAPVAVGVSRKRIIRRMTGCKAVGKNLGGSVGAAVWCAMAGASVVRVHDVRETVQALRVVTALAAAGKTEACA